MFKRFQRNTEDFTCTHCGLEVLGDGYTNHCPECLWSQHVDVNPGDRASVCGGLMRPIGLETHKGKQRVVQKCEVCGFLNRNKLNSKDNQETVIKLSTSYTL